jgi:hypothetical protein
MQPPPHGDSMPLQAPDVLTGHLLGHLYAIDELLEVQGNI